MRSKQTKHNIWKSTHLEEVFKLELALKFIPRSKTKSLHRNIHQTNHQSITNLRKKNTQAPKRKKKKSEATLIKALVDVAVVELKRSRQKKWVIKRGCEL
ncbi:hypothetical protein Dsin_031952 [Dipteronia sinensis]|uniref:Uncharacterized protein n=1 Tax=Dipteronia sinensis TaxID=43782 RepID=A0AAE0DSL1_9ROSI|nr:hypothetical protein Dsin_031952 [Dipteronia sinensis]